LTDRQSLLVDLALFLCSVPHLLAFTCRFLETVSGRANPFPRCDRKPLRRAREMFTDELGSLNNTDFTCQ